MPRKPIGVLALQGDFELHRKSLEDLGRSVLEVRAPAQLARVRGLIIPGGESTTVGKLLISSGLADAICKRSEAGTLALFGTCMGVILLAKNIQNRHKGQYSLDLLDITVERNAYGRQVDSFEADLPVRGMGLNGTPFRAVFIRAPKILATGPGVETLAEFDGSPVLIRQNNILGATFHPEITVDTGIHKAFCEMADK
jgi:5'-phosphate synthase pdxT subunit